MNGSSHIWTSQSDASVVGAEPAEGGGYHPRCGEEHDHKPTKALIGVALLVVLGFLLYEFKTPDRHPLTSAAQHQTVAAIR